MFAIGVAVITLRAWQSVVEALRFTEARRRAGLRVGDEVAGFGTETSNPDAIPLPLDAVLMGLALQNS